jgi:hypothetical protein
VVCRSGMGDTNGVGSRLVVEKSGAMFSRRSGTGAWYVWANMSMAGAVECDVDSGSGWKGWRDVAGMGSPCAVGAVVPVVGGAAVWRIGGLTVPHVVDGVT